jgi:hypothetical protein
VAVSSRFRERRSLESLASCDRASSPHPGARKILVYNARMKLGDLSDAQLLESLKTLCCQGRMVLARLGFARRRRVSSNTCSMRS